MGLETLVKGIAHVGIRVKELERSRAFYERLGFVFVAGPLGPEPVAIVRHPCGTVVNFILNATSESSENVLMDLPEKHAGYTHMALEVTHLDTVVDELKARNVPIAEGPIQLGPNARAIFVRDPDGNVIELNEASGED